MLLQTCTIRQTNTGDADWRGPCRQYQRKHTDCEVNRGVRGSGVIVLLNSTCGKQDFILPPALSRGLWSVVLDAEDWTWRSKRFILSLCITKCLNVQRLMFVQLPEEVSPWMALTAKPHTHENVTSFLCSCVASCSVISGDAFTPSYTSCKYVMLSLSFTSGNAAVLPPPTDLQESEHLMNLRGTQMTPCALIPLSLT